MPTVVNVSLEELGRRRGGGLMTAASVTSLPLLMAWR